MNSWHFRAVDVIACVRARADRRRHPVEENRHCSARIKALERCDLGSLIAKLDRTERWDQELSLGEQERLAFARLLLHKPGWVFLDEATAALDEDSQRRVMRACSTMS